MLGWLALRDRPKPLWIEGPAATAPVPVRPALLRRQARPLYPYSVIRGGVYNSAELLDALERDPVARAHYADFDRRQVRAVALESDRTVYVSYRVNNAVFWTGKPVKLHRGETVLTDGAHVARARCGNRVDEKPHVPVAPMEPPPEALNVPEGGAAETLLAMAVPPSDPGGVGGLDLGAYSAGAPAAGAVAPPEDVPWRPWLVTDLFPTVESLQPPAYGTYEPGLPNYPPHFSGPELPFVDSSIIVQPPTGGGSITGAGSQPLTPLAVVNTHPPSFAGVIYQAVVVATPTPTGGGPPFVPPTGPPPQQPPEWVLPSPVTVFPTDPGQLPVLTLTPFDPGNPNPPPPPVLPPIHDDTPPTDPPSGPTGVPEPATVWLLLAAVAPAAWSWRRRVR